MSSTESKYPSLPDDQVAEMYVDHCPSLTTYSVYLGSTFGMG